MVTFRFYVVSVVAFFLALAVGVVLGSALDGRISASLKNRLERVEANLDSTVDLIDQKNEQISALNKYSEASVPFAVQGRLEGTSTLIVAQSGINADQVGDVVAAVRQAGSTTPGILWIDKSWDPGSAEFRALVQDALGEDVKVPSTSKFEDEVWSAVLRSLGAIDNGDGSTTTTTTSTVIPGATEPAPPDTVGEPGVLPAVRWWDQPLLRRLADGSVLNLQSIGQIPEVPGGTLNVIAVTGPDSHLGNRNSEIAALVHVAAADGVPIVVADMGSANSGGDVKDSALKDLIEGNHLTKVSSVQGADEIAGRVAVVVSLQRAAAGEFGNYGRGPLASSLLPEPPRSDTGS